MTTTTPTGTAARRWALRTLLAVGLLAAFLGGAAAPAAAEAEAGERLPAALAEACPFSGTLCLFTGTNFTGERFTVSSLVPPGTCVSLVDHLWTGRARSAINTNSSSAALFPNDDCAGGPYQVPGNSAVPDFGEFRPNSVWVAD